MLDINKKINNVCTDEISILLDTINEENKSENIGIVNAVVGIYTVIGIMQKLND